VAQLELLEAAERKAIAAEARDDFLFLYVAARSRSSTLADIAAPSRNNLGVTLRAVQDRESELRGMIAGAEAGERSALLGQGSTVSTVVTSVSSVLRRLDASRQADDERRQVLLSEMRAAVAASQTETATAMEALRRDTKEAIGGVREDIRSLAEAVAAGSSKPDAAQAALLDAVSQIKGQVTALQAALAPPADDGLGFAGLGLSSGASPRAVIMARQDAFAMRTRRVERDEDDARFHLEATQASLRRHISDIFTASAPLVAANARTPAAGAIMPPASPFGSPLGVPRGPGPSVEPAAAASSAVPTAADEHEVLAAVMLLEELRLGGFVDCFVSHGFGDVESVLACTDDDLVAMGIVSVGTRRTVLTRLRGASKAAQPGTPHGRSSSTPAAATPIHRHTPAPTPAPTPASMPKMHAAESQERAAEEPRTDGGFSRNDFGDWVHQRRAVMRAEDKSLERSGAAAADASAGRGRSGSNAPSAGWAEGWEVAWRAASVRDMRAEGAFERAVRSVSERVDAGCHVGDDDLPAIPKPERRGLLEARLSGAPPPSVHGGNGSAAVSSPTRAISSAQFSTTSDSWRSSPAARPSPGDPAARASVVAPSSPWWPSPRR
jgi:hypothetical protein